MATIAETRDLWADFRMARAKRVDLEEIGLEGYWVELIPTSAYPSGFAAKLADLEGEDQRRESMKAWVKDWNLPQRPGKSLPIPSVSDEWDAILPLEVVAFIIEKVVELDRSRVEVPATSDKQSLGLSEEGE